MKHKLLDDHIKTIIIGLRKKGRKEGKNYLVALSNMLDVARRKRAKVNVIKLNLLGKRHKEKIFLVPGTVLGYGKLELPITVYAFKYSRGAKEKIEAKGGKAKTFDDLINEAIDGKDVMIVK